MQPQQNKKLIRRKKATPPSPKKVLLGCGGCAGLSLILFIAFVFVFVGQTNSTNQNPMAKALGMQTGTFVNTLIDLVNLIFGSLFVLILILGIIGIFRMAMARKDDKLTKKKGLIMAGSSALAIFLIGFIWVGMYMFLDAKRVPIQTGPVAGIVTEPATTLNLTAPVSIKFDASYAPISKKTYDILSYSWDFGDGKTASVPVTTHTFTTKGPNNGRYDVKLNIDKKSKKTGEETKDTYTKTVTIANVKLSSVFKATPQEGQLPLEVSFDATESNAPAGEIVSYEWDFNNDNVFTDAKGATIKHTFDQIGTYKVNLRVTDNTGQYEITTKEIKVSGDNVPLPIIEIPSEDGSYYVGKKYILKADKSTTPNGEITSYEWDFGDNSAKAKTKTATHIYKEAGD